MSLVHGVDVSKWEPTVDWRLLRSQGFRFAFIKATEGPNIVDPKFAEHWAGAREAGILRSAYHYLYSGKDAKVQAEFFINTIGSDRGELPPVVDLEGARNEDVSNTKIVSTCKEFLDIIEGEFDRKPIVYSRRTYLNPHVMINGKAPDWASDYDLWVAQYPFTFDPTRMPNENMPKQPEGWKAWKFWQYSESAILESVTDEGRPTEVDVNWFRGTEAELFQYANIQPVEETTYTIKEGDTFHNIAENHGLSLTELLDANPSLLQVGSTLTIPGHVEISEPSTDTGTSPSTQPQGTSSTRIHVVQRGDTLSGIALRYGTTIDAILAINPQIINRNIIFDGQEIKIP